MTRTVRGRQPGRPGWLQSILLGVAVVVVGTGALVGLAVFLLGGMADGAGPKPSWPHLGLGAAVMLVSGGTLFWFAAGPAHRLRARRIALLSLAGVYGLQLLYARWALS